MSSVELRRKETRADREQEGLLASFHLFGANAVDLRKRYYKAIVRVADSGGLVKKERVYPEGRKDRNVQTLRCQSKEWRLGGADRELEGYHRRNG